MNGVFSLGWPLDGGQRALVGLTRFDPQRLTVIARACHDSAAISIAGDPKVTAAALAGTLR